MINLVVVISDHLRTIVNTYAKAHLSYSARKLYFL